jgi:hypothetical protein
LVKFRRKRKNAALRALLGMNGVDKQ